MRDIREALLRGLAQGLVSGAVFPTAVNPSLGALAKTSMFLRVGKTAPDTSPLVVLITRVKRDHEPYRAPQPQHCVESLSGRGLREAQKQGCFWPGSMDGFTPVAQTPPGQ